MGLEEKIPKFLTKIRNVSPIQRFLPAILSFAVLISALIFTSFSLTGNVVGGLTETNSLWIGTVLFVLGLVFAFLYFKGRKKDGK